MADTRNKRKFDDSGPNVSYNRVPPPLSDFEQARQKAMQIAARLSQGALDKQLRPEDDAQDGAINEGFMGETKSKHKFDDSGSGRVAPSLSGVELAKQKAQQLVARFTGQDTKRSHQDEEDSYVQQGSQGQLSGQFLQSKSQEKSFNDYGAGGYYGMHGPPESRKVEIPNGKVGLVIGKGGETIKSIQLQSGARVQITKDMDHNPNLPYRTVELMGTPEQIKRAEQAIQDVIAEADAAAANSAHGTYNAGGEQIQLTVPTNKVGLIIGRGGETIKSLQSKTGARIQLVPLLGPPEYHSGVAERVLTLMGSKEQVDAASEQIKELISENRIRGPAMQGGYNQGYNAPQPPSQWGPPGGPPTQQGYGYQQGPYYPGPSQSYGSFPPPPPAGWSQLPPPPPPPSQQFQPGGGYGYYNQPGQMGYSQNPHSAGYDQQSYAEQPPGASQEAYGQQPELYGQVGAHQTYGSPPYAPPGVSSTTYSQGSHAGYGPPGVGDLQYGLLEGQGGDGKAGEEVKHSSQPGFGQTVSENEKQSSEYRYDEINETSYEKHVQEGQQANYEQVGTGYWNNNSVHYSYSGYEASQSSYGEQISGQSGYEERPVYEQLQQDKAAYGAKESSRPTYPSYQGPLTTQFKQEQDVDKHDSPREYGNQERRDPAVLGHDNGYLYNGHYDGRTDEHVQTDAGSTQLNQEPQS